MIDYKAALSRIRLWCKVTDGGCWIWHGCINDAGQPRMWFNGRGHTVRRVVLMAKRNRELPGTLFAVSECGNPRCVSPDCLRAATRSEYLILAGKRRPDMALKRRMTIRRRAKLTAAQVAEMRSRLCAGEGMAHLARAYGVTAKTVYRIKLMQTWRDLGIHLPA